jgi:hypothetical protein
MSNEFKIMAEFLNRPEAEVEGRALLEAPAPIKQKLLRFAQGTLLTSERAELVGQLNQNRHWIALLAQEVKARRQENPDSGKAP